MQDAKYEILVWLPSPMGDAILCTPALRAIRRQFQSSNIWFFANPVVRRVLSPGNFNDEWIQQQSKNPFVIAKTLKEHNFTHAILFKNSFASALAVYLARIPFRIGYAREGRSFFLTDKLDPLKLPDGRFEPVSMVDYYIEIASKLGADTANRDLELLINPEGSKGIRTKLPEVFSCAGPVVILVPGGAYGPSKFWSAGRFAQTADWLIDNYDATVILSVASNSIERQIAEEICALSKHKLVSLTEKPVNLGELKALFSIADLVIGNDTGPRHIAIALQRKVITLLGPNNPAWTDTNYENEVQIVGNVPCAPCTRPICEKTQHLCMQAITVKMVCDAAEGLLENKRRQAKVSACPEFIEISKSCFVNSEYKTAFGKLGLTSIDDVFSFNAAELTKKNLARFRSRLRFEVNMSGAPLPTTVFLKRYDKPPVLVQLKNWLSHHSGKSCAFFEFEPISELAIAGVNVPEIISYGEQWGLFFEKRSFIATEKIPDAESLERQLPDCFYGPATSGNLKLRRSFIVRFATFVRKFHETDYRHRDLYFSHIFYGQSDGFCLIDLARAFRPVLFRQRLRIKDIAQVHYSAPVGIFSKTDRLRFYLGYADKRKLTREDKAVIRKVVNKARRMARHNIKHCRPVPFLCRPSGNRPYNSAKNKKVAIIIERANIALGGAERSIFELAAALSGLSLEVDILAAAGQANTKSTHILCGGAPHKRVCYYSFAKALRKHLSENHYDIIHSVLPFDFTDVYQPRGGTYAETVLRNAASYQNKFIESYKKLMAFANFRRTILLHAERKLCKQTSEQIIIALSEYVARQFEQHYGIESRRLVLIPNGVKVSRPIDTGAADRLRTQVLMQMGLKEADKPVLFLFVANNFRLKGLSVLIKALHLAATHHKTGRSAFLIVAGNGKTHKYRHLAKKLDVHNRVVFLGHVSHIQNALSIIDVAILPTFYDPSSRFILEAIAAGKPVITTRFNGATDLFVDNRHGKVIDTPGNISALAKAITYFTDPKNIRETSEAIITDNLKEKVSVKQVARHLLSVYDFILQRKGRK